MGDGRELAGQMVLTQRLISQLFRSPDDLECVQFFALFCGVGGASLGALAAGHSPAFAVDLNEEAVRAYSMNVPGARVECGKLPGVQIPYPEKEVPVWLHGSPPCQRLSAIGHTPATHSVRSRRRALKLVRWFLREALAVSPTRWSMEQAAHPLLVQYLKKLRRRDTRVDFVVLDFCSLGLPQSRVRLLAGPPRAMDRVRAASARENVPRSIQDVLTLSEDIRYMRGTKTRTAAPKDRAAGERGVAIHASQCSRRVDKPAFTVTCSTNLRWLNREFKTVRVLSVAEKCALQCLPEGLKLPKEASGKAKHRLVGNALPPLVLRTIMPSVPNQGS